MGHPCNCNNPLTSDSGKLNSNPDVAGIGVLVGLTLPAMATFILLLVYYFSAVEANSLDMWTKLDVSFLEWLHMKQPKWRTNGEAPEKVRNIYAGKGNDLERVLSAMEQVILSFSDAQLVNAFSLLLGAFTMGCSMDPYHWQIMVQCVWFTSATHLATIPILRIQLYNAQAISSRLSIYIRATLMTFILLMLVASLVPTGHPQWLWGSDAHPTEGVTLPALCFFDYNFPPEDGPYASRMTAFGGIWLSWSIGLATVTFLKRLVELITPPKKNQMVLSHQPTFRTTKLRKWNKSMDKRMGKDPITKFFWHSFQETLRTVWRLLESFGGHIFWLFIMLSWNIYLLIYNKWYFHLVVEDGGDNKWSFGQTTPLVLLILPAMTIVEECFSEYKALGFLNAKQYDIYIISLMTDWSHIAKEKKHGKSWSANNLQLPGVGIGKTYDESTRITIFLMFEFLLLFALLATINFVSTVQAAGSDSGARFLVPFLACLLAAPLVFTHIIHLADNIFEAMNFRKNTCRNSLIAVIVALSIGAAISFFFVQEYYEFFEGLIVFELPPLELRVPDIV